MSEIGSALSSIPSDPGEVVAELGDHADVAAEGTHEREISG